MKGKLAVIFILVVLIGIITGCAAIMMPTIMVEYPKETNISDITAAAAVALQNHEFSIAVINDNIGVVTTNWKDVKPTEIKTLEGVSSVLGALSGEKLQRRTGWRMMVTITVDKQTRKIKLKPIKQIESKYGGWNNAKLNEAEEKMLNQIQNEILNAINAPATTPIIWERPESK